jgi:hypothetical protein
VVTAVVAVGACGLATPAGAAPAKKLPVTMTFRISPGDPNVQREVPGDLTAGKVQFQSKIVLSGRAARGATGNAGRVDLYFVSEYAQSVGGQKKLVMSLKASDSGAFSRTVEATASGYYTAVYRGNTARATATADTYLQVVYETPYTVALTGHSDTCAGAVTDTCTWVSPQLTVTTDPIRVTFTQDCGRLTSPKSPHPLAMSFTFGSSVGAADSMSRGWSGGGSPGVATLLPKTTSGVLSITTNAGCTWTVVAIQTHLEEFPVLDVGSSRGERPAVTGRSPARRTRGSTRSRGGSDRRRGPAPRSSPCSKGSRTVRPSRVPSVPGRRRGPRGGRPTATRAGLDNHDGAGPLPRAARCCRRT